MGEDGLGLIRFFVCSLFSCALLDRGLAASLAAELQCDKLCVKEVVDPMASSGWQAALLALEGLTVLCSDVLPGKVCWTEVRQCRAQDLPWSSERYRTAALLL